MVDQWQIAAKALLPLPNLHSELSEESRVRHRYLDLIVRDQARDDGPRALDRDEEPAPDVRGRRLPRGRDADAAGAARRRRRAPVRHALERVRHRAVHAHRPRAVPQARGRGRHRSRLRDQPQLPQRGLRLDAQPRVRDARGLRGIQRLQRHRRPDPEAHSAGRDRRARIHHGHVVRRHRARPRRRVDPHLDVPVALARPRASR